MKVSVSKWKNQTIYYLSKSVWVDGKSTTKTIEKIGSEDELLKVSMPYALTRKMIWQRL